MMMKGPPLMNQPIILLKEGTDASQGKHLILSNIEACRQIVNTVQTTMGPRGQDKLISTGQKVTITNDGATIMELLSVVHPAARLLVDISQSQDAEVGDGTTSVVVLAGELLEQARPFVEDGVNPQIIVSGYRVACDMALEIVESLKVDLSAWSKNDKRSTIEKCAETSLNSKLLSNHKQMFGAMVYEAISTLDHKSFNKTMLGIKKVHGGSITDSFLVQGIAFKKCFSYAGFEAQPKSFTDPKILLLNLELELKAEKENAEIRIDDPREYQKMIDAEWKIIFDKLDLIVKAGAEIVLSRQAIGDLATQYFADRNIFCAGRVEEADIQRTAVACKSKVLTTVSKLSQSDLGEKISSVYISLGTCGKFEERQIGRDRYNIFSKCPNAGVSTIILRGGAHQFIDEAERSLNDAIMTSCRALQSESIVGGGGAIEMEVSTKLREFAKSISGTQQFIINAYARALEVIPRVLAANSGLDTTDVLNRLRHAHHQQTAETKWIGVACDQNGDGIADSVQRYVWEPIQVKLNSIAAATEAACSILSVDEMVKNPKSNPDPVDGLTRNRGKAVKH